MNTQDIAVIILAAGKGTRMKSDLPKVLHPMAGMPMLGHVITAAQTLNPSQTVVITGYGAEDVESYVTATFNNIKFARQTEQLGTGHAVLQAESALAGFTGTALLLCGDVPLTSSTTLTELLTTHRTTGAAFTIATATVSNPEGLGRIIRDANGTFSAIIEHKDATEDQRAITEINTGLYAATCPQVFTLLKQVTNHNVQNEYYLPDAAKVALATGLTVTAMQCSQPADELMGVNTPQQLAAAEATYLARKSAA